MKVCHYPTDDGECDMVDCQNPYHVRWMEATAGWVDTAVVTPSDPIHHPKHYTSHPSGIECIQVVEHMGFNIGNAIKYLWRADLKGNAIEDLQKARQYIDFELARRQRNG